MKLLSQDGSRRFLDAWNVYKDFDESVPRNDYVAAMLELIARMEHELDDDRTWYGITSHYVLHLHREPDYRSTAYIWVSPTRVLDEQREKLDSLPRREHGCFLIEYRIREIDSSWPEALMEMRAVSVTECLAAIAIALRKCG